MEKFRSYVKLPARLSRHALSKGLDAELRLFAMAKLDGHRSEIKQLLKKYEINDRTGRRLISKIIKMGWATSDGKFLFCKSWRKIGYRRKCGKEVRVSHLQSKKKFIGYLFASAAYGFYSEKAFIQNTRKAALEKPAELGTAFSTGYMAKAMGIPERTYKSYKQLASTFKFINIEKQRFSRIGDASQFNVLRQNMKGISLFIRGRDVVHPEICRMTINLQ